MSYISASTIHIFLHARYYFELIPVLYLTAIFMIATNYSHIQLKCRDLTLSLNSSALVDEKYLVHDFGIALLYMGVEV